jgi:hemolysin activation/secretion protein
LQRKQPEMPIPRVEQLAPPGAEKIKFELRELIIEGATVYSPEELREFYAELIGTEVSVARLFAVAKQIQQKYRDDGYPLTRVIIEEQTIRDGLFRLRVIEGFINRIKIQGDIGPVSQRVQAYLEKIIGRRPVREQDIERYLLLAGDIPGVTAVGTYKRDEGDTGASELVVIVKRKPFDTFMLANNRGSRFTGTRRAAVSVQENASTPRIQTSFWRQPTTSAPKIWSTMSCFSLLGPVGRSRSR